MEKARDEFLDTVSGVLILWIVAHHAVQFSNMGGLYWVFIMIPWFFFKSGIFFHPERNNSFGLHLQKRFVSLGIPMIFWAVVGYLVFCPELVTLYNKPFWNMVLSPFYRFLRFGDFLGNEPLWFLLSLLFVQIVSFYIVKIRYYYIFVLLFLVAGYYMELNSIILPLGFSTLPLGLFFYFTGFVYKIYFAKHDLKYFIMIGLPVFILMNIWAFSYVDVHKNRVICGSYLAFVFLSLLGIIFSIYIARFMRCNFFVWAGQKSLYFFVLHWPVFNIVKTIYRSYIGNSDEQRIVFGVVLFISAVSVCSVTILLLNRLSVHWKFFKYI